MLSCIGYPVAEVLFRLVGFQPIPSSTPPNPSPILPPAGFWLGFDIPAISAHTPPGALPVFFPSAHPYLGFLYSGCFGGCQPQEELHGFFEASPTVIPEPGTIGLFATGLLAGWLRLRHSRPTVRKRL